MNPTIFRILFALFLIAHGWIHMSLASVPTPQPGALRTPFFPSWWRNAADPQWPVRRLGVPDTTARTLGWLLWLLVTALYALAGLALIFVPGQVVFWQACTVGASLLSLVLLGLYWHPWLPVGIAIDIALLAAIALRWPVIQFVSA
jgi:hypothetical protein